MSCKVTITTEHTPELQKQLNRNAMAVNRQFERRKQAIALLKQRAEHDPVIEAIVTVLNV